MDFKPITHSSMPSDLDVEDFSTKKEKYVYMSTEESIGLYLDDNKLYEKNKPFILPQVRDEYSVGETPTLDLDVIAFAKDDLYKDDKSSVHN
eukprot:12520945-Ditylum_brightwellii.AAC.1